MTDDSDKLVEKYSRKFEREVEESKRQDEARDFQTPVNPVAMMRMHDKLRRGGPHKLG